MQEHQQISKILRYLPPLNPFLQFNNTLVENRNGKMNPKISDNSEANDEIEFQTQSDYILNSPSLWTPGASKDQAYNYHLSPRSRLQAIVDGKRQLMEMIQDMPDSCLELSLRDIVLDDQQGACGVHQAAVGVEDVSVGCKAKDKIKGKKHRKISRSQSMDSGVFLLKMFVPTSLYSKKKSKTKSCSRISPNPQCKELEKSETDWWKMIYFLIKNSRSIKRSLSRISIKQSMSRSIDNRLVESSSLLDKSSFDSKRYTSRNQRGCLF